MDDIRKGHWTLVGITLVTAAIAIYAAGQQKQLSGISRLQPLPQMQFLPVSQSQIQPTRDFQMSLECNGGGTIGAKFMNYSPKTYVPNRVQLTLPGGHQITLTLASSGADGSTRFSNQNGSFVLNMNGTNGANIQENGSTTYSCYAGGVE